MKPVLIFVENGLMLSYALKEIKNKIQKREFEMMCERDTRMTVELLSDMCVRGTGKRTNQIKISVIRKNGVLSAKEFNKLEISKKIIALQYPQKAKQIKELLKNFFEKNKKEKVIETYSYPAY